MGVIRIGKIKEFVNSLTGRNEKREMSFSELLAYVDGTGGHISIEQAMQIPALAGGVNLITETVAMLPVRLYREEAGEIKEVKDDVRTKMLNQDTGDTLDAFQFKQALTRDYLLGGSGFAFINRKGNKVESLHYVDRNHISILSNVDVVFKDYSLQVQGKTYAPHQFIKLFRNTKNGWDGRGIIAENMEFFAGAYNLMRLENAQAKNGGVGAGFLTSENVLTAEQITDIKKSWANMYGTNSDKKIVVLNNGIKFEQAMMSSVEQQLNERKLSNAVSIGQILRIPTELLAGKYEEDIYSMAVKLSIAPILDAFAVAINRVLLLESEKKNMFFAFDDRELLKGDTLKRYQAYALGIEKGFLQVDDVRYQENMKALGLEYIRLGLQDVLFDPKTKEIYTPNTGLTGKVGMGKEQDENRNPKRLGND